MTHSEAGQLIAVLHGAYPGTYFDGAVAEVFTNSLMTSDYELANTVITEWVNTTDRFPTVAEINGAMRRHRERSNGQRELPRSHYESADRERAAEAFSRGYIRARTEAGDDLDVIQPKLDRLLQQWKLSPASEAEPRERTGSESPAGSPSMRRPGYLRASSAPPVDQPAFDDSTIDEPW
jgi:hypothetical protein